MTTQNYTHVDDIELCERLNKICSSISPTHLTNRYFESNFPSEFSSLVSKTKFLDDESNGTYQVTVRERIYCLEHNITEHPKCQYYNCKNIVRWNKTHFKRYCCCGHALRDPEYHKRRELKCLNTHGVRNPMQLKSVQQKLENTMMTRHGVKHALQCKKFRDKQINTFKSRSTEEKIQSTLKKISTCQERYGTDNPMQSDVIKNKSISTCMDKYGTEYSFQSESVKEKIKHALMNKFGVENPSKVQSVREKAQRTTIERYGYRWYTQSPQYHISAHKPYMNPKYPDMTFGSSWEFKVYDFLTEHSIEFEYQPQISFEYEYDGKIHTYHPDFKVHDRIYEVKGEQFFRINESTGQEEMFCPYRYPDWSDEYYTYICGLYEAKYQCMMKNKVIILRKSDICSLQTTLFSV